MSNPENSDKTSSIQEAIRAKRERKTSLIDDIEALEASLLADIEAFDLDAAERRAQRELSVQSGAGMSDASLVFPEIAASGATPRPLKSQASAPEVPPERPVETGGLLDQLRRQAEIRRREEHSALAERTATNEAIDRALKHAFFFLHEFVQQVNIVKPAIPRDYPLLEKYTLSALSWQEGFADYRTQSQSAGALVELVSFSYRLVGAALPPIERDGPAVERFRAMLFDFGLPFTCKEFKNERSYVESAEFQVSSELSVSARWRAYFAKGMLTLETRNLERLGSVIYHIVPTSIDQLLLDEFGRLVLGQPSRFRELAKRT